jgi:fatty-acyl-CoA synthase
MNLAISLKRALSLWPDKEAVVDGEKRLTYRQFGRRVAALAVALHGAGVTKGTAIAALLPNCLEYLELYYAAACLGAILCPVNYRLSGDEVATILKHSQSRALIYHADFKELAQSARKSLTDELKLVICVGEPEYELFCGGVSDELVLPDVNAAGGDLAQIYYTSGTTGDPKGVMLSHDNVSTNALGAVAELALSSTDCWAHSAPMFHLVDAWAVFSVTWVGGKHVFTPYFNADQLLQLIDSEKVTITALVPTMINAMLNSERLERGDYASLHTLLSAGSPIAPELVKQLERSFSCLYYQFYGMTETSPFLTISLPHSKHLNLSEDEQRAIRSKTGRAFIAVELKVVREDGTHIDKDSKEVGEIIARGANVTSGYWNNAEATARAIRDGWIYTGDLAVMDADGYVNIVDRSKDMIISGGENVYSTEVEYVLYEHKAVMECAVFGIPDPKWGELVHATIVLRAGESATSDDLDHFVRSRLARYKVPRHWEFTDGMPKTGSGKILKKVMREKYWQNQGRNIN